MTNKITVWFSVRIRSRNYFLYANNRHILYVLYICTQSRNVHIITSSTRIIGIFCMYYIYVRNLEMTMVSQSLCHLEFCQESRILKSLLYFMLTIQALDLVKSSSLSRQVFGSQIANSFTTVDGFSSASNVNSF